MPCEAVARNVRHDHVEVDLRITQRAEDLAYNYADSDLPYPSTFGNALYIADPAYATENLVVLRKKVIAQQGRTFTWEVPTGCPGGLTGFCFDAYGRPTKLIKSSAP